MPGYKPKTRFVVDFLGTPRELFSVRQRSNGDLVILSKSGRNHEEPDGTNNPIVADRTSVHVSKRSGGTTIKQTIELESGKKIENAAYIRDSKQTLLWMIRAQRSSDLRNERYVVETHPKDIIVLLPSFDAEIQCLQYTITVFRPGTALPDVSPMYGSLIQDFQIFSIIVHFGYVPVPSLPHGDSLVLATNTPRINSSEQTSRLMPQGGVSKSAVELAQMLFETFSELGDRLLARIERDFPEYAKSRYFDVRSKMSSAAPFEDFEDLKHKLAHAIPMVLPPDNRPHSIYINGL